MENNLLARLARHGVTRRQALHGMAWGGAALSGATLFGSRPAGAVAIDKVTIAVGDEPPVFDGHKAWGAISTYFTNNVYEGLTGVDIHYKTVPGLATDWSVSPDGLAYEFKLRRNAKFHTGDPVTAGDVEFSFRRYRDPKVQPHQVQLEHWKDIQVVDDHTVRIILSKVDPTFVASLSYLMTFRILSKNYYARVGDEGFEKAPVGTGPYKFVRRSVKEFWELERFDDYWGGAAPIKRAVFRVIPEAVTLAAVLKTGEVDMVQSYPAQFVAEMMQTPGYRVIKNKSSNTIDIRINSIRGTDPVTGAPNPYLDRRVRLAMNHAIDKDAIINSLLKGMGEKIAVLFPEDIGYDPALKAYPYDPKKARQLLAEAGYPNGLDATFYGLVGQRMPMSKEVCEIAAQYLTAVGLRTKVANEEYGLWLKRSDSADAPDSSGAGKSSALMLYPFGYGMTFVGGSFHSAYGLKWQGYSGMPNCWWWNKDYDAVVDRVYQATDPVKVEQLCREAAQVMHDGAGYVPLYRMILAYAMKDTLQFTPTVNSTAVELKNLRPA